MSDGRPAPIFPRADLDSFGVIAFTDDTGKVGILLRATYAV